MDLTRDDIKVLKIAANFDLVLSINTWWSTLFGVLIRAFIERAYPFVRWSAMTKLDEYPSIPSKTEQKFVARVLVTPGVEKVVDNHV